MYTIGGLKFDLDFAKYIGDLNLYRVEYCHGFHNSDTVAAVYVFKMTSTFFHLQC